MAPWFPPTCPSLGGSGKTIAFLGPILATLGKPGKDFARCLIVDPSRELAPHGLRMMMTMTMTITTMMTMWVL